MNTAQKTSRDKLVRIQRFLRRQARSIPESLKWRARASLDELLEALEVHVAIQRDVAAKDTHDAASRRALKDHLLSEHLRPIVAVARASAEEGSLLACVRAPHKSASAAAHVTEAMAVAHIVDKHRQIFLDQCFREDFLEGFVAAADALKAALVERERCRRQLRAATLMIRCLLSRGYRLGQMIDVLVRLRIRGNARLTAEWRAATARAS
jgi:D-tyrosyl-tRNA(Tyr) deacylase